MEILGTLINPRSIKNKLDDNIPTCTNNHMNIYDKEQTKRLRKEYNNMSKKRFIRGQNPTRQDFIINKGLKRKQKRTNTDSEFSDSDLSIPDKSCSHDNTYESGLFLDKCNNCIDNKLHERQFVKKQKDNNNYASQFEPLVHNSIEPVSQNAVPQMYGSNSMVSRMEAERGLALNGGYSNFNESGDMTYGIVEPEHFTHTNMNPNFKQRGTGLARSEKAAEINQRKMELFIGSNNRDDYKSKRESKQRFDPITNMKDLNGLPSTTDYMEERFIPGKEKRNERPFQQIKVTSGIGLGANGIASFTKGTGDMARVLPRNVDEIRPLNKPKLSYEGVVVPGQKGSHSAIIGKSVQKRAPVYRELGSTHELEKTFAETSAPRIVGEFDPNRIGTDKRGVKTNGQFGTAQHIVDKNTSDPMREKHKQSNKQSFLHAEPRNVQLVDVLKPNANYESFTPNLTQREQENKHYGGVNHDSARKSYALDIVNTMPDLTKRNIHSETDRAGQTTGESFQGQYFDPSDVTKLTYRAVDNEYDRTGNTTGETQNKHYYDINDITKITNRTVKNLFDRTGNAMTGDKHRGQYFDPSNTTKMTQREAVTGKVKHVQAAKSINDKNYTIDYANATPGITKREQMGNTTYLKPSQHIIDKNYVIDYANATPDITKREQIGETTYIKPAKHIIGKEQNRTSANNSKVNITKEILSKGRTPTLVSYIRSPTGDLTSYEFKEPFQIERAYAPGKLIQTSDRLSFNMDHNKNPTSYHNDRINSYPTENLQHNPYINNVIHKAVYNN
jgi:hypothetical protein